MTTDFCRFVKGVIGKKLPADSTLNQMKKADIIDLLHLAQKNYETLLWFYNNAVNANLKMLDYEMKEEIKVINGREVLFHFDERRNLYLISGELMEEIIVKLQEGGIDQE